jgi:hypothetical protein
MLWRVLKLETLVRFYVSLKKKITGTTWCKSWLWDVPTPRHADTSDLYLLFKSVLFVYQEMRFVLGYIYIVWSKKTHVFQIIVPLFIFNIKKLCQHQNNL